jgi:hypothetical protein
MTNAAHRLLILSNPKPGRDDEFNAWYDEHLEHILAVPGFEAAQRFKFSADQFPPDVIPPSRHEYLTIYEVSLPPEEASKPLLTPEFSNVPDAFDRETERAYWYSAAGELQGAVIDDPEQMLVVFSNPRSEELEAELNAWYDAHLHEVIGIGAGVVNAQRFRLSDVQFPADVMPPSEHRYLALYDTDTPPAHTASTLARAMADYEHPRALDPGTLRDWMFTAVGARARPRARADA